MVLPAVVLPAGQPRGWALPTYIPFMYLPTPSRAHHPVNASKSRTVDINKDEVLFCSFCPGGKFSGGKGGGRYTCFGVRKSFGTGGKFGGKLKYARSVLVLAINCGGHTDLSPIKLGTQEGAILSGTLRTAGSH